VPRLVPISETLEAEIGELPPADGDAPLSDAERSVLALLPSDLSYRDIAERLSLPLDTVRARCQAVRHKLGAATRDEAVTAARRLELI
jgi:LuxR family transcriptional regulator, maltose regulon positive regulatory protein